MKKLIYPQLALLLLASAACSSDDAPVVPDGDVVTVAAVPQNVDVVAPDQTSVPDLESFNGTMAYAGGQTITYQTVNYRNQNLAFITAVGGTNTTVAIPGKLTLKDGDKTVVYEVFGWNLNNYEGIGAGIETIRIPANASKWYSATTVYRSMEAKDFSDVMNQSADLKNIEIGADFPGFCSIAGAVYTSSMKTFICCPQGRAGEFVVANGVETIGQKAFFGCNKLTRIVLPESTQLIDANALDFDTSLLAIDILAPKAPKAGENAFGAYARNAKLRVAKGSRPTYFPAEFTSEAPEMPEEVAEITSPTSPSSKNSKEAMAAYIKACNLYSDVAKAYAQSLVSADEMLNFYVSDDFTNAGYVTRLDKYVAAKNNYYSLLTKYQILLDEYKDLNAELDEADVVEDTAAMYEAYEAAQEAESDATANFNDCSRLYSTANTVYKDRVATYEEELNDYEAYKGYEFFNPANITEITFSVK